MIECIEHLSADLEDLAFSDRKLLGERSVQIPNAIGSQLREIARRIARNIISGIAKAILIQNSPSWRHCGLVITQASFELGTENIRSLIAVGQLRRIIKERQRLS